MKNKVWAKVLDLLFSYIIPIILISIKYDLFKKQNASVKLTTIGTIVVVVLLLSFMRNINNWVKSIENATTRKIIDIVKNLVLMFALCFILIMSKDNIDNLIFIIISCGVSITIGNLFREDFRTLCNEDEKIKRENEMINAFRKAKESE